MSPKPQIPAALRLGAAQYKLIENLSNALGVSGDEGEVRKLVKEAIEGLADEVTTDALGNILAVRKARQPQGERPLRVLLSAHMDEVGFMIVQDDGDGIYRFEVVGGIDTRILPGKPVIAGKDHTPGVIGARPIHLTTASERRNTIGLDTLRIDVGPGGKKLRPGDRAGFATRFERVGGSLRGKALDDRLGVTTLIQLLRNAPANIELIAAFTTQEEIGLRGARVAGYAADPDLAIALDCTPALDLPHASDEDNTAFNTRLDGGPAIYVADSSTLSDPRLIRHFVETAETLNLPYQIRQPGGGGTDAGAIHRQRAGIPSLSISTPGRYLHTPVSLVRADDWQHTLALLHAGLERLTPALLASPRA